MLGTQTLKGTKTNYLVKVALLSAVAAVIMFLEFIVPMMPVFLKMDLSEIPVLVGTFALGPIAGVTIELIKNLIHLPSTSTAGIGEIANFVVGIAFVIPAGIIYRNQKNRNGAILGMIVGIISMTTVAAVLNYFVFIPLYQTALHWPLEAIIDLGAKGNPAIVDLKSLIILGIIPFNLLKGIIISVVTLLIYKKLSPILRNK
ncbi:MAG: riboflavin transporter [Clostridiales bacterium]|nr:riboflavin transporter [Clostridiales bacterium]MDK2934187.1 riboflavin transporter [Clostridiales bacterium]